MRVRVIVIVRVIALLVIATVTVIVTILKIEFRTSFGTPDRPQSGSPRTGHD